MGLTDVACLGLIKERAVPQGITRRSGRSPCSIVYWPTEGRSPKPPSVRLRGTGVLELSTGCWIEDLRLYWPGLNRQRIAPWVSFSRSLSSQ
jgi:hypothetical protein